MADIVSLRTVFNGNIHVLRKISDESDNTGVTGQVLFDLSALNSNADYLQVEEIAYSVNGFNYVVLDWDRSSADETIAVLKGDGVISFVDSGPLTEADPSAAGTGDIIVTSDGGADGSSFEISVLCRYGYL